MLRGVAPHGIRTSGNDEPASQCIQQTHRNGLLGEPHELFEGLRGQGCVPLPVRAPTESHAVRVVTTATKPTRFDVLRLLGMESCLRRNNWPIGLRRMKQALNKVPPAEAAYRLLSVPELWR